MQPSIGYEPDRNHEVRVWDVEYLQTPGQTWEARIYQPQGTGPFPALLYVHGGAWNTGDRTNNELLNEGLAASGLVVVAVDFRLAPDHKYPAQVVDVNYATRWVKAHASEFNARPRRGWRIGLVQRRPHHHGQRNAPRRSAIWDPFVPRAGGL